MAEVLLVGAYGQGNPGDDALLAAFVEALPGYDVVATSADPDVGRYTGCRVVPPHGRPVGRALLRCDAVVFGGGTVFKALHPHTGRQPLDLLRRATGLATAARLLGKPTALVGVGAAPLRTEAARRLSRALASRAGLLVLRDEESAGILASAGVPVPLRVGADAVWPDLAATVARLPRATDRRREGVLVAVSHHAPAVAGRSMPEALADALGPLVRSGTRVEVQPWQMPHDAALASRIADRLGGADVLPPPANLAEAAVLVSHRCLVVGLRFHALVAAAAVGTPFVAIAHEPKLAALARRFGQPAVPAPVTGGAMTCAIERALAGPHPLARAVDREVAAAREQERLLRLVASRGREERFTRGAAVVLEPTPWR